MLFWTKRVYVERDVDYPSNAELFNETAEAIRYVAKSVRDAKAKRARGICQLALTAPAYSTTNWQ